MSSSKYWKDATPMERLLSTTDCVDSQFHRLLYRGAQALFGNWRDIPEFPYPNVARWRKSLALRLGDWSCNIALYSYRRKVSP